MFTGRRALAGIGADVFVPGRTGQRRQIRLASKTPQRLPPDAGNMTDRFNALAAPA
jgi:hypothetical protein